MKFLFYNKYRKKREDRRYSNIKDELKKIEKKVVNANSVDDLSFYQHISHSRKILRFGDKNGGYRLSLFFYKDDIEPLCLFVDFESKHNLEGKDSSEELFNGFRRDDNSYFLEYINRNKGGDEVEYIDLNSYSKIINFEADDIVEEVLFESANFSKYLTTNRKDLDSIFQTLKSAIIEVDDSKKITYKDYKSIYKINDNLFYKSLTVENISATLLLTKDDNFKEIDKISSKDELLKRAIKSYPLDILLDDDSSDWIEYIVKNSDGNIALSPEEEGILLELKSYSSRKYPFFINGRAGSGKSTILQYLFASYLIKFLELKQKDGGENLEYEPLYLTYNDRLKEKAIDKVISIILAKTPKSLKEKLNLKERTTVNRQIEEYFKSFDSKDGYNFLEELLYLNRVPNSLKDKKRLSFEGIKEYFEKQITKRNKRFKNFSPELIWYVIRSYIKGRGEIENDKLKELTIDGYKKLSKKLKTIEESTYENIYNNFYKTYKNYLKSEGLYDDLDLVFEVYKNNAFNKKYSIIFCDEAQDFTKVEFDLILNLNIFLQKNIKIDNFNLKDIPIVFAGDPFQTINPTGFSFEYLKALVYDSYSKMGIKTTLNYKELEFNYRSNDEIIKFSNLIQLLRGVLFKDGNIKLQTRWLDNFSKNSILLFTEPIKMENFYQFIFPTNKKEEYSQDRIFESLEIENLDRPIDIKGLEYEVIVIYRFGDFFLKHYGDNLQRFIENGFSSREEALKYEYFMNNFYVAITRAKRKIIIIDSKEAKERFWSSITVETLFNKYREINGNIKIEELLSYREGRSEYLEESEENRVIFTSEKLKTDIFERYDSEKISNKKILLSNIERVVNSQSKLNSIYKDILAGLKSELDRNHLLTVKYLMRSAVDAKKSKELSNDQISFLVKKSFDNLYKSVIDEDSKSLELLREYRDEFVKLGVKYERRVKLLERFLSKRYFEALEYIKSEFDVRDKSEVLDFIITKSLDNLDDYELVDTLRDLFEKELIGEKEIIDIVRERFKRGSNYKSLIKVFNIGNLKRDYKSLYCEIATKIDDKNVDCLIHLNRIDRVIELLNEEDDIDITDYYRQILFYVSKQENNVLNILESLDFELIVENYMKFYKEFDSKIWRYIFTKIFILENSSDIIPTLMKFFEDKNPIVVKEHMEIVIDGLRNYGKPFLNKHLFNTFVTIFSDYKFEICDVVCSLENSINFKDVDSVKKILGYYNYYLQNRGKYKGLVGSRFIKIKYEYDIEGRKKFESEKKRSRDSWLDFVNRRVKFLKAKVDKETLKKVPNRLDFELCKESRLHKIKYVEKIYKKIIIELEKREKSQDNRSLGEILLEDKMAKDKKKSLEIERGKESLAEVNSKENINSIDKKDDIELKEDSKEQENLEIKEEIKNKLNTQDIANKNCSLEYQSSINNETTSKDKINIEDSIDSTKFNINQINKDNIVDILESIQEFIEENKDNFTKREIRRIYNTVIGIKDDIDSIRESL